MMKSENVLKYVSETLHIWNKNDLCGKHMSEERFSFLSGEEMLFVVLRRSSQALALHYLK